MTPFIYKTIAVAFTLFGSMANAQGQIAVEQGKSFHGLAIYESKTEMPPMQVSGKEMSDELVKQLEAKMKKQLEKTFVLHFNKYESNYKEEVMMETPQPSAGNVNIKMVNTGDVERYKNLKDQEMISEQDMFGKEFLIVDKLPKWDWKMGTETKKIGDYTCYKAVAIVKATEEELAQFRKDQAEMEKNPNRIIMMQEPVDYEITAWYTPEIPLSQGPADFWGLPGLILEVNDGHTVLLCSKIILNPKEKTEIRKPKTGQKISQKDFDELMHKKTREMQSMPQRRGDDGGVRIRMGG